MARSHPRLLFCLLASILVLFLSPAAAIKLRISTTECIEEVIDEPKSLVTMSVVAGTDDKRPAFFDIVVRDPESNVVFSKLEVVDSELAFKTRVPGRHTICLTVSRRSTSRSKPPRTVRLDVLIGRTFDHDKITDDHLDELIGDVSDLGEWVQKLLTDVRRLRYREARHRITVDTTSRRVVRYAIIKLVAVTAIAIAQPLVLSRLFKDRL